MQPRRHPLWRVTGRKASILDEALDPLIDEARRAHHPEVALLALTVVDPASLWLSAALLKDIKGGCSAWSLVPISGRLGQTAELSRSALGDPAQLETRIESLIQEAERETDLGVQHEIVTHGLGLMRAWCESFVPDSTTDCISGLTLTPSRAN